jgi:hypothetical protein
MSKPEVVPFVPAEHYAQIAPWWTGHNWPVIPMGFLPATGFIVPGVAVGFIYSTDSDVALMEWIVSNPKATPRDVVSALSAIIKSLKEAAKENGYTAIFSFIKNEGLKTLYQRNGFKVTDTGMTHVLFTEGA